MRTVVELVWFLVWPTAGLLAIAVNVWRAVRRRPADVRAPLTVGDVVGSSQWRLTVELWLAALFAGTAVGSNVVERFAASPDVLTALELPFLVAILTRSVWGLLRA